MPKQRTANNAFSTLSVAVSSNTQASITVQAGHGARFPQPKAPNYFLVTLDDGTNVEVLKCIDRSGDVLTCLRGYEGTTAQASFATGTKVEARVTADTLEGMRDFATLNAFFQLPVISVASIHIMGVPVPTALGTAAGQTLVNSSWRERQNRTRFTSTLSAGGPAHLRSAMAWMGAQGGGKFLTRFGFAIAPTSSHFFIGLIGTTGAVASIHPPTSMTNGLVIGYANSGLGCNLSVYRADSGAAPTVWDLGSYFTVRTDAWYELAIETQPNEGKWKVRVSRLDISSIADVSTSFTDNVPNTLSWMSPMMHSATLQNSAMAPEWGGWRMV